MSVETIVHPVRFAVPPQIRLQAGPVFDSDNVGFQNGQVQSNVNWEYPLWDYVLQYRKTNEDMQEIKGFFMARRGMGYGFFFADPVDYNDEGMGSVKLVNGVHRLVKTYPDVDDYAPMSRLITRPITGTVDISAVPGTSKVIDYTTGIVTGTGVGEGAATFEFDVPCKFMTNACQATYEPNTPGKEVTDWVNISIRELRRWRLAT